MKYLPYVLKHLRRNRIRALSTIAALAVCIFLFCTLQSVLQAIRWGLEAADASRLVTRHAVSVVFNVPLAYEARLAGVPGVKSVAISTWFGGFLTVKKEAKSTDDAPDWSNFFPSFAVEPEPFFGMHPEYAISTADMQAFLGDQQGCIVGRGLADQFGWKAGDRFSLESFIPPYRKKDGPFAFVVRGVYDVDTAKHPGADRRQMFFHHRYLYEGTGRRVAAGTYAVQVTEPGRAAEVARAIDALFENSDAETRTETEAAFRAGFINMAGNLALLLNVIGLAVIFTILLVTANTMSMAVRERRTEIAVLKTLGFGSGLVMALVMAEALLLGVLGGVAGVGLSAVLLPGLRHVPVLGDAVALYPSFGLSLAVALLGLGLGVVIAFLAGVVPSLLAYRARITTLLRTV